MVEIQSPPPQPGDIRRNAVRRYKEQRGQSDLSFELGSRQEDREIVDPLEVRARAASQAYRQGRTELTVSASSDVDADLAAAAFGGDAANRAVGVPRVSDMASVADTAEARVQAQGGVLSPGSYRLLEGYEDLEAGGEDLLSGGDEREKGVGLVEKYFHSFNFRDTVSRIGKGIMSVEPSDRQQDEVAQNVFAKIERLRVFGVPASEFIIGTILGIGTKALATTILASAGLAGGWGAAAVVGGVVGGVTAGYKDINFQARETISQAQDKEQAREDLKGVFKRLKHADKIRLAGAVGRGAAMGAVGAAIGFGVVEFFTNNEAGVAIASPAPEPKVPEVSRADVPLGALNVDTGSTIVDTGVSEKGVLTLGVQREEVPLGDIKLDVKQPAPDAQAGIKALRQLVMDNSEGNLPEIEAIKEAQAEGAPNPIEPAQVPAKSEVSLLPQSAPQSPPIASSPDAPNTLTSGALDAGQPGIAAPDLAKIPEMVPLPPGSNPWEMSSGFLREVLGREPTNAEILEVTKTLCRESNISVPGWGIEGEVDHTKLPVGFKLVFNDNVRKVIGGIKK